MSESIESTQIGDFTAMPVDANAVASRGFEDLRRLSEVPVDVSVEIGRARMTVGETLSLRPGSIISLSRTSGEPVDLLVNGTLIARGEVVVIDEQFGLRVTQVLSDAESRVGAAERAA